MMIRRIYLLILAAVFCALSAAGAGETPDYSSPDNWVIRETGKPPDRPADLFYVLPTIFSHKEKAYMQWSSNPQIRKIAQMVAAQNTGIFAGYCRIHAPYYRQAEFRRALLEIGRPVEEQTWIKPGIGDVKTAFRYYLKHHNQGRPFILFGFSQGAMALLEVMKTELADPAVRAKLVAAYLIGYPRMPKKFPAHPHLQTASGEVDTGVIITYNSQAPGKVDSLFTGSGDIFCINPVNWRTDGKTAPASAHRGSRFFDRKTGKMVDKSRFVSTRIDPATGALIVIPQEPGKYDTRTLGQGVYHMNDLNFFYHDLQINGKNRLDAFLK